MSLSHVQSFALNLQSSEPQHTARGAISVIQKPKSHLLEEPASVFLPSPDGTCWLRSSCSWQTGWSFPLFPLPPDVIVELSCFTAPKALNRWSLATLKRKWKGILCGDLVNAWSSSIDSWKACNRVYSLGYLLWVNNMLYSTDNSCKASVGSENKCKLASKEKGKWRKKP